jgi:peptide/nickel transport system substrate-binding protein
MLTRRDLLVATAASPLLATGAAPMASAATPASVVVMAMQIDDVISLDPGESYEFTDNEVCGNVYRKLVLPDETDAAKVVGDLAKSWDISADGLTFTFHLGDDAHFASGKPVTAGDAAFSLQRLVIMDKAPGFIIGQFGFTKDNVEKLIHATDDKTLVMQLPAAQAPSFVLNCLSSSAANVVEQATVMAHAVGGDYGNGWLKTNSAGAGPFRLTSWAASDHIILDANPASGIAVQPKRIVIRHVADPAAQLLLLQKGDADIARNLTPDQIKTIAGNPAFHSVSRLQATSLYIAMNEDVPALAKQGVRQAIKWAIGYDAIAQNITPNLWGVSQSFLPKGLPGALPDQPFHKDTAKAKQLLAEAGYPDGVTLTMDFITVAPYGDIAQAVQADLAEAGIKLQLLPGEQKQVITKTRSRTHQLAMLYWGSDYFDPNSNAQGFCANPDDSATSKLRILAWRSHFVDKELTAETLQAANELNAAKRIALYQTMQRQFWERAPFAILLQRSANATLRSNVTGLYVGPMPDFNKYARIVKS